MTYVDAHLHLADPDYASQVDELVQDATKNNVTRLLSNAIDYPTSLATISLADRHQGTVIAAVGVHPWTVANCTEPHLEGFEELLGRNAKHVKAIGEIGLDGKYTRDPAIRERQRDVFRFFLELAHKRRLPVVVHSRMATDEVLESLSNFELPKVLLHWYAGPIEQIETIRSRGYLISIGPSIYYSQRVIEIAREADLNMILTETDGPGSYGPFKGRTTRPSFVIQVVQKLAEIKRERVELIRETIWNTFQKFIPTG